MSLPSGRTLGIGAVALLVLTVAVAEPRLVWVAVALDVFLLAGWVVDGRRAARTPLTANRVWPPLLVQGVAAPVDVRFEAPEGGRFVAREALHPGLAGGAIRVEIAVRGGGLRTWRYDLVPRRRGTHAMGPLTVRVLGPWGLAWAQRDLLPETPVRVFPQVRWEGNVGRLLVLAHRRELGQVPLRHRGQGTEPYGLREYRPGDPPHRIHWKATARHRRVISREDTWERGRRLVVLLDCGRAMASVQDQRSKLDHALAAALALVRVAASRSDAASVVAFSDRMERRVRVESRGLARVYAALFDVEARLAEPAFDELPDYVASMERRRATVVLFTSVVDLGAADALRAGLLALSRRHRVVLVNLEDPDLARLAGGVPETTVEAYAKVSAMGITLANRRLGRQLRRSGIRVVTTPADRLTWGALEAYLDLAALPTRSGREASAVSLGG